MVNDDVAAIADPPAPGDGSQAEIELLPAEEQSRVVTTQLDPGGASDGMAGTDEGGGIEAFARGGQQRQRIAPGQKVVGVIREAQDAATDRGKGSFVVQRADHARHGVGRRELRIIVQCRDHAPAPGGGGQVAPAGHPEIAIRREQAGIGPPIQFGGQPGQIGGRRPLVEHGQMPRHADLPEHGGDRGQGLLDPIQGQHDDVGIVTAAAGWRGSGNQLHSPLRCVAGIAR